MELGASSVSLSVKDINASRDFYKKLGFKETGGDISQNWLIMKNGNSVIGLFQGMFEGNILTFNPGWDQDANSLTSFTDVRVIEKDLKENGVELLSGTENESGPASIMLSDPDGNTILIDQHV